MVEGGGKRVKGRQLQQISKGCVGECRLSNIFGQWACPACR